jgi:cell pole-organizing protein PopZ
MEEILASLRRIMSDDGAGEPVQSNLAPAPARTGQHDVDVLASFEAAGDQEPDELLAKTQFAAEVLEPSQAKPDFDAANRSARFFFDEAPDPDHPNASEESRLTMPDESLLSPRTMAAVDTAFNSLARTVLTQNPRTLEDLVREMLKPMLKAWLDDNLPGLVERLVRAEIERLSRGRG